MRIILFQNDKAVGIFAQSAKIENIRAMITRKAILNPGFQPNVQKVPVIRDDGTPCQDLDRAADIAANVPEADLREQLLGCYEDWLEVCYAVTGENRHFNPDELIAKIHQLKGK